MVLCGIPCMSQGISVRNNLLWDASGTANIGLEIPISEHWTIGANGAIKTWPRFFVWDAGTVEDPSQWKYFSVVPEVRYYPGQVYNGWFLGADLLYTHFNAGKITLPLGIGKDLRNHRQQGDFYGAGLFAGHSWWLSDHFRIEAEAGLGAGYRNATRYECAHCGAELNKSDGLQLVPKLGINIAWNLTKRNTGRKAIKDAIEEIIPAPVQVKEEEPEVVIAKKEETEVVEEKPVVPEPVKSKAEELAPTHPILRPSNEYTPYTKDMVIRKMEGALFVYYEFGKSQVKNQIKTIGGTRDNTAVLDEIIDVTRQILADSISSVNKVQIVGLCSFEGGRWGNERLSLARAQALKKYVQGKLDLPDDKFEIYSGGEAWTDLRDQLSDLLAAGGGIGLTTKQIQKAIDIIDEEKDLDRREVLLKEAEGGIIYSRIRRGLFADQRNAGYLRIYYDVKNNNN